MNNHDCIVAVLVAHREARHWTDEEVAHDLVAQLGLDPVGDAANAKPVIMPGITEDEVVAHETAAQQAVDKARAAREALEAQKVGESQGDEAVRRLTERREAADADLQRRLQDHVAMESEAQGRSRESVEAEHTQPTGTGTGMMSYQDANQPAQSGNEAQAEAERRSAETHDSGEVKTGGGAIVF